MILISYVYFWCNSGHHDFDVAIFGVDEVDAKSPYSFVKAILAPGFICAQYAYSFRDTNKVVARLLGAAFIFADIALWARLLQIIVFGFIDTKLDTPADTPANVRRSRLGALLILIEEWAIVLVLTAAFRIVIFPFVPWRLTDWCFRLYLVCVPFWTGFRAFSSWRVTLRLIRLRSQKVVEFDKVMAVIELVKSAELSVKTFENFDEKYSNIQYVGELPSKMGIVCNATTTTKTLVSIKCYSGQTNQAQTEAKIAAEIMHDAYDAPYTSKAGLQEYIARQLVSKDPSSADIEQQVCSTTRTCILYPSFFLKRVIFFDRRSSGATSHSSPLCCQIHKSRLYFEVG